jgi:hypothetical protein
MQSRRIILVRAFVIAIASLGALSPCAANNTTSAVGTNFWGFGDNQYTWPFVDFFKQSRAFWSSSASSWDDGRVLTLDTNGYPVSLLSGQYATTLLFWGGDAHYPVGDYVLLYDGVGQVLADFSQGPAITVKSSDSGRIVVTVPAGTNGFRIRIMQTTPGNYVRNIRFIAPGFESSYRTQVFHPTFLKSLAGVRCLRFMDWMQANGTKITEWSQRTTPSFQSQGAGPSGVALEYLVDLCNRLNCDGWFCLPVRGSNDCFTQYATYIRDHLNPCLKAYFEYGNEVWNGGVQSNVGFVDSIGTTLGFTGWDAQHHGWARRLTDMQTIVTGVYAGKMDRCVRVIATQVGNTGVVDGLLNFYNAKNFGDVIAVAPYFNPNMNPAGTNSTVILDSLAAGASRTDKAISGDLAYANQYNMKIVGYESGLDVWPSTWGISDSLAIQIRFNPRMYDIYTNYYTKWKSGGGTLINQYTFCNPYWGMMRYQDQDTSKTSTPIYCAAMDWAAANPRWWSETREACVLGAGQPNQAENGSRSRTIAIRRAAGSIVVYGAASRVQVFDVTGRSVALVGRAAGDGRTNAFTPAGRAAGGVYFVRVLLANGTCAVVPFALVR